MSRKLPPEAFDFYLELGLDRSYREVADHFGVSKVSVAARAKKENWQGRLREVEKEAHRRAEEKAVAAMEAVRERQLQGARFLQARALEALRGLPPEKGVRAAAALNIAWKHELLLLGDPTERQAQTIEEVVRRESERWLALAGGEEGGESDER
jgi:hypothetical protein